MFSHHAFIPSATPCENHSFGLEEGARTFKGFFENVINAKEYCNSPFEKYIDEEGKTSETDTNIPIEKDEDDKLFCGDSSYLEIDDKSVDVVITDPPYFDNVMYSELSDFFYIWLRKVLKDDYDYFQSKYAPKSAEAVKNPARDKDEDEFTDGLTRVFAESNKKLKDDGIMTFTFHHSDTEAWGSVLKSVFDAGFYITAVYPIQSEMSTSMHIQNKGNIEYDMIIICRKKQDEPERKSWSALSDQIYLQAKEVIKDLEQPEDEKDRRLSKGDMFVIAMGKCLELYSKHYPNVIKDESQLAINDALEEIREIVDTQFMSGKFDELERKLDTESAAYLAFLTGRSNKISYSNLNKELQQRNISIEELIDWGFVQRDGSNVKVLDIDSRAEIIENKKEDKLSAIDRAQYLIYLKNNKKLHEEIEDWINEEAIDCLEEISKNGEDQSAEEIIEYADNRQFNI